MKILKIAFILWSWLVVIALSAIITALTVPLFASIMLASALMFQNPVAALSVFYQDSLFREIASDFPTFNFVDRIKEIWRDE